MPEPYHTELSWQERALHYGDGLFETLLKQDGQIPLWDQHVARLTKGCSRLSIHVPDPVWLKAEVFKKSVDLKDCVVKMIVSRGQGGRGLKLPSHPQPSVFVLCYPWQRPENLDIEVKTCDTRLPINPRLAGIKHLNRLDYVLASLELQQTPDLAEGILCDYEGYLVEGIISNLFFIIDNQLCTPSLELAGVEGIMRQQVLQLAQRLDLNIKIDRYPLSKIDQASEIFMCNSVRGICPVVKIDDREIKRGGITEQLLAALAPANSGVMGR
ncbi:MAG: aminodeoxychorismate lyase [Pseudomonadota bacterium]